MKKATIILIALLIITAGLTFYYFSEKEYVFRLTESQIQEKLNKNLPLTKSYLFIFQVTLDNPRVTLTNGSKRVGAGLDVILNIQIGNESKPLSGSIDVSGGVKYLPDKGQFFLTDSVIENLKVEGVPAKYTEKVNSVLTKALAIYYAEHPIYSLRASDVKQAAVRLVLKDVIIQNSELVVTLGI
jgi:hypothetical protein